MNFGEMKTEIVDILKNLEEEARNLEMASDSKAFSRLRERVEDGRLKVIVIGEFNRGKSTFINALLGENVLPTAVRPTTATINIVNYGETPKATVHFKDGHSQKIDIERLEEYVTVQGRELADVKFVDIAYPTGFCREGVQIIDTPGVNDLDKQREEVTYGFIPGADAAVLVLDSEAAVSQSEMVFLEEKVLKNDIKKIFVVLNKCEQLDEDDLNEVLEYARDKLSAVASADRIFPLSAKDALRASLENNDDGLNGSGLLPFRESLSAFLLQERGKTLLSVPVDRALRLSGRMVAVAALRKESLELDGAGQKERLTKLEPALAEHDAARDRLKKRMEKAGRELSRHFEAKIREEMLAIGKSMAETIDDTHIEADFVKDVLPDILQKKVCQALEENQKEIQSRIGELEKRAIDDVRKCINQLDTVVFREISFHEQKQLVQDLRLEKSSSLDKEGMMFELGPVVTLGGFSFVAMSVFGLLGLIPAFFGAAYIKDLLGDKQQEKLNRDLKNSIRSLISDVEKKVVEGSTHSIDEIISTVTKELVRQIDESQSSIQTTLERMKADLSKSDAQRQKASSDYTEISKRVQEANHSLASIREKLS